MIFHVVNLNEEFHFHLAMLKLVSRFRLLDQSFDEALYAPSAA